VPRQMCSTTYLRLIARLRGTADGQHERGCDPENGADQQREGWPPLMKRKRRGFFSDHRTGDRHPLLPYPPPIVLEFFLTRQTQTANRYPSIILAIPRKCPVLKNAAPSTRNRFTL